MFRATGNKLKCLFFRINDTETPGIAIHDGEEDDSQPRKFVQLYIVELYIVETFSKDGWEQRDPTIEAVEHDGILGQ